MGIFTFKNSLKALWTASKISLRGGDRRILQKDEDFRLVLLQILRSDPEFKEMLESIRVLSRISST